MAKKLTVEVDAETSKAKRKIEQLAATGGSSVGADAVSSSADRAARSLDKVSRAASSVTEEAGKSSASMTRLVRSFAGIGAGMAASYAANHMDPGIGKTSLGYASAILSGAGTGAMMGSMVPGVGTAVGAAVGGAAGAAKQYLDNSKSEEDWFKDFKTGEKTFQASRDWAAKFEELTSVKTHFKGISGVDELKAQLAEVEAASQRTAVAIKQLKFDEKSRMSELEALEKREGLTAEERIKLASEEASALALTRQKLAQVEGAAKRLDATRESLTDAIEEAKPSHEARASMSGVDALARVGGDFAGSDQGFRNLQRLNEKQVALLEKIEAKTGKGAGKF